MNIRKLIHSSPISVGRRRINIPVSEYIRKMNGISNCYASVYNNSIKLLFFDFDEEPLKNTIKMHNYLLNERIKHVIIFSGRGFHLYVVCKEYPLQKNVLWNSMNSLLSKSNSKCDRHVIGDVRRISRIVGTKNIKVGLYCIPLFEKDISKDYEYIRTLAKKPRLNGEMFGNKKFVLNEYDYKEERFTETNNANYDFKISDEWINNNLPPLIKKFLRKKNVKWRERFLTILAMKEKGLSLSSIVKYCSKYWNKPRKHGFTQKNDLRHSLIDENQFNYIFNGNYYFPNWETLSKEFELENGDWEFKFYK